MDTSNCTALHDPLGKYELAARCFRAMAMEAVRLRHHEFESFYRCVTFKSDMYGQRHQIRDNSRLSIIKWWCIKRQRAPSSASSVLYLR